jgi:hypothetical protein
VTFQLDQQMIHQDRNLPGLEFQTNGTLERFGHRIAHLSVLVHQHLFAQQPLFLFLFDLGGRGLRSVVYINQQLAPRSVVQHVLIFVVLYDDHRIIRFLFRFFGVNRVRTRGHRLYRQIQIRRRRSRGRTGDGTRRGTCRGHCNCRGTRPYPLLRELVRRSLLKQDPSYVSDPRPVPLPEGRRIKLLRRNHVRLDRPLALVVHVYDVDLVVRVVLTEVSIERLFLVCFVRTQRTLELRVYVVLVVNVGDDVVLGGAPVLAHAAVPRFGPLDIRGRDFARCVRASALRLVLFDGLRLQRANRYRVLPLIGMLIRRVLVHFVTQIVHEITMRTLVQVQVVELEMLEETFDVGLESPLAVGARQGGFLHVQGVQVVTQIRLLQTQIVAAVGAAHVAPVGRHVGGHLLLLLH